MSFDTWMSLDLQLTKAKNVDSKLMQMKYVE